jgi:uncharacterized membrane protein
MFAIGLGLGVVTRLFDIYTEHLGKMFSQTPIWILLCTLIAIYSKTKVKAMLNVFAFCIGMLITYYVTAAITHGVYSKTFIIGWAIFALFTPIMAFFAWLTKENYIFSKVISIGIVAASVFSSILMFNRLRVYDFIIDGLEVYFLFFKKIQRQQEHSS